MSRYDSHTLEPHTKGIDSHLCIDHKSAKRIDADLNEKLIGFELCINSIINYGERERERERERS